MNRSITPEAPSINMKESFLSRLRKTRRQYGKTLLQDRVSGLSNEENATTNVDPSGLDIVNNPNNLYFNPCSEIMLPPLPHTIPPEYFIQNTVMDNIVYNQTFKINAPALVVEGDLIVKGDIILKPRKANGGTVVPRIEVDGEIIYQAHDLNYTPGSDEDPTYAELPDDYLEIVEENKELLQLLAECHSLYQGMFNAHNQAEFNPWNSKMEKLMKTLEEDYGLQ